MEVNKEARERGVEERVKVVQLNEGEGGGKREYEENVRNATFCLCPRGRVFFFFFFFFFFSSSFSFLNFPFSPPFPPLPSPPPPPPLSLSPPPGISPASQRIMHVASLGCIPVILSDGYYPPFSQYFSPFFIIINEKDVNSVVKTLLLVEEERIRELKENLRKHIGKWVLNFHDFGESDVLKLLFHEVCFFLFLFLFFVFFFVFVLNFHDFGESEVLKLLFFEILNFFFSLKMNKTKMHTKKQKTKKQKTKNKTKRP